MFWLKVLIKNKLVLNGWVYVVVDIHLRRITGRFFVVVRVTLSSGCLSEALGGCLFGGLCLSFLLFLNVCSYRLVFVWQ